MENLYDGQKQIEIFVGDETLFGFLAVPKEALGLVVFVHGSGSSRFSPRNQFVAKYFREKKLATLLFDLLTPTEEKIDQITAHLRFDIPFLANRLDQVVDQVILKDEIKDLPIGYIGSSTGAAAALIGASKKPELIKACVSRGGRVDLAKEAIPKVFAPTLLIVGSKDDQVIALNQEVMPLFKCEHQLKLVEGATHLFEEEGTLEKASKLARDWFLRFLR